MRCLWMLEEMGEPYQLIEKSARTDELQSADYIRLNPNARIPAFVDGDLVLWESVAINLYLAQKYTGPMHCVGPKVLATTSPSLGFSSMAPNLAQATFNSARSPIWTRARPSSRARRQNRA
jgi:glutathione S-transferase